MRDSGKFSKKFEGRHSYFLYLEPINDKKDLQIYVGDDEYKSPPPAPRYRRNSFIDKHFNKNNIPNKYHISSGN
jgi:hypothetical protein